MNKLNDLLEDFYNGTTTNEERVDLIEILHKELISKSEELEFMGNQLMDSNAENALLKQKLINRRVS